MSSSQPTDRLPALDGWRAISVLSVLAAHMLPIGPHAWHGNDMIARFGMSIFFILSGFLIISTLWRDQHIGRFVIRRLARIVPLAWLALVLALSIAGADGAEWAANLFFYANLPPFHLAYAPHFWSLGVEMQFYAAIALAVAVAGKAGLWTVPAAALAITALRVAAGEPYSIVTWFRVDEILAGGCLALVHVGAVGDGPRRWLARLPIWLVVPLTLASAYDGMGWLNYARPYLAVAMVGSTLYRPNRILQPMLEAPILAYIARISFALYVIHAFMLHGWFGEGSKLVKYLKRPIGIAITFALAHLSTAFWERPFIAWSHRLAGQSRRSASNAA